MGVTYNQGKNMKNIYKSFALLCMGLAATACIEENFGNTDKPYYEVVPGEDIVFSATAGITSGGVKTRTEYGNVYEDASGKHVEVKWLVNDKLEIASEQSPIQKAVYNVTKVASSTTEGKHNVSTLEKAGDAGLQWSDANSYDFYAMYPSAESFEKGSVAHKTVKLDLESKSITGYIAQDQKPVSVNTKKDSNGNIEGYVAEPDMRYAHMAAHQLGYDPNSDSPISLDFKSLVTALQFDITAETIAGENVQGGEITVTSVILQAVAPEEGQKAKDLCGAFTSNIADPSSTSVSNDGESGYSQVVITLGAGYTISDGQYVNVTFFVLPQVYSEGELKLTVYYIQNGVQQNKTATISQPLMARKKYSFNDMSLPVVGEEATPSNWFSNLDGNILVSQLSLAVAGNVFATQAVSSYGVADKNCQQVKSYTDLWNMGVRGFEFVNQSTGNNTGSLGDQKFVCAENILSNTPTFGEAFTMLTNRLHETNETLVLVCTYQASNDGYKPYNYVANLLTYLESFVTTTSDYTPKFTKDDFVQITKNTTVADLQGNIAIIIRPGDDDRYESASSTSKIDLGDWAGNLTLIEDWGTAFDVWDRRYTIGGETPAREATFDDKYVPMNGNSPSGRPQVESWLYGVSTSSSTYTLNSGDNDFNSDYVTVDTAPVLRSGGFDYLHVTNPANTNKGTAFIQEWTRVVPRLADQESINTPVIYKYSGERSKSQGWLWENTEDEYMWVKWYESITEKKDAIKALFEKSVTRDTDPNAAELYINVLSGYYVDENITESYLPFKATFPADGGDHYFKPSNQGKGGNYKQLARDLNKYTYELLNATPGTEGALSQEGPWGLVMMDHIGLADDGGYSQMLVNLIMMNNFKFPLDKAEPCSECGKYPCECEEDKDTDPGQGGDAI